MEVSSSGNPSALDVPFGQPLKKPNQRWVLACASYFNLPLVTVTSPVFGGVAGSVILSERVPTGTGVTNQFVVMAANVPTGTSGDITFNDDVNDTVTLFVARAVNLDFSAAHDTVAGWGTGSAVLSIDCPAGGGVIGFGMYGYSSGSTPTSADFANLTTLHFFNSTVGSTVAGTPFATVQTGLNVTYDPQPNTNLSRCEAVAISAPSIF